jgi:hypothetical protein
MTIETKYNIGDEVWFMNENKAYVSFIEDVRVKRNNKNTKIEYMVESMQKKDFGLKKESDLFPTKEELLKSL